MIYLLHFERPYPAGKRPQHYMGHADYDTFDRRLAEHRAGSSKARFTQVMAQARIAFVIARVWPGSYELESLLKRRGAVGRLCPICREAERVALTILPDQAGIG